jgi:hypothetical protein
MCRQAAHLDPLMDLLTPPLLEFCSSDLLISELVPMWACEKFQRHRAIRRRSPPPSCIYFLPPRAPKFARHENARARSADLEYTFILRRTEWLQLVCNWLLFFFF